MNSFEVWAFRAQEWAKLTQFKYIKILNKKKRHIFRDWVESQRGRKDLMAGGLQELWG